MDKLAIRREILRHLETANKMMNETKPSSILKVATLQADINAFENYDIPPDLNFWRDFLA